LTTIAVYSLHKSSLVDQSFVDVTAVCGTHTHCVHEWCVLLQVWKIFWAQKRTTFAWISVTVAGFVFEKLTTETSTWAIWKQADVLQPKQMIYLRLLQVFKLNTTALCSLNNSTSNLQT